MANLNNKSLEELFKIESEEMESDFEQDSSSSEAESEEEHFPETNSNFEVAGFDNKNPRNVNIPIMKLTCDKCEITSKKAYFSKGAHSTSPCGNVCGR